MARIEAAVLELLEAVGEDPHRPELAETPARVAQAYSEFFSGVGVDAASVLGELFEVQPGGGAEPVLLRGIHFRSMCEHHLLPFVGNAHVAYVPRDGVIGLGRVPALVDVLASRPQLQERLGDQIAQAIEDGADARGVLVVLEAAHGCVTTRGPRQVDSTTVTVASRGSLAEPAARAELMRLIGGGASAVPEADVEASPVADRAAPGQRTAPEVDLAAPELRTAPEVDLAPPGQHTAPGAGS